jgi:hypothetical protein
LQDRIKELLKQNEKLKLEAEQWKAKFEGVQVLSNEVGPLRKELTGKMSN